MHFSFSANDPVPLLALIFGIMIIAFPKFTRILVGVFLILFGVVELFDVRF